MPIPICTESTAGDAENVHLVTPEAQRSPVTENSPTPYPTGVPNDDCAVPGSENGSNDNDDSNPSNVVFGDPTSFGSAAGDDLTRDAPSVRDRAKAIEAWAGDRRQKKGVMADCATKCNDDEHRPKKFFSRRNNPQLFNSEEVPHSVKSFDDGSSDTTASSSHFGSVASKKSAPPAFLASAVASWVESENGGIDTEKEVEALCVTSKKSAPPAFLASAVASWVESENGGSDAEKEVETLCPAEETPRKGDGDYDIIEDDLKDMTLSPKITSPPQITSLANLENTDDCSSGHTPYEFWEIIDDLAQLERYRGMYRGRNVGQQVKQLINSTENRGTTSSHYPSQEAHSTSDTQKDRDDIGYLSRHKTWRAGARVAPHDSSRVSTSGATSIGPSMTSTNNDNDNDNNCFISSPSSSTPASLAISDSSFGDAHAGQHHFPFDEYNTMKAVNWPTPDYESRGNARRPDDGQTQQNATIVDGQCQRQDAFRNTLQQDAAPPIATQHRARLEPLQQLHRPTSSDAGVWPEDGASNFGSFGGAEAEEEFVSFEDDIWGRSEF